MNLQLTRDELGLGLSSGTDKLSSGAVVSWESGALFLPKVLNPRLCFYPIWKIITGCDSSGPLWGAQKGWSGGGLTMGGGICCGNVIFLSKEELTGVGMQPWKLGVGTLQVCLIREVSLWTSSRGKKRSWSTFPSLPHGLGTENPFGSLILR